jgi:hypothetical protein
MALDRSANAVIRGRRRRGKDCLVKDCGRLYPMEEEGFAPVLLTRCFGDGASREYMELAW